MRDWKECEGQLLDGKYALERYVGGDPAGAVFLIGFAATAVRIRRAEAAEAAALLERWNRVKLLRHPNLLEIDAAGAATLAGEPVAYLVMEHAEENLGEILNDRPLTADETREMLLQVADALAFLHGKGLAHGELRASNILAVGDRVKLSSESVAEGDPAADVRALGSTLIHALTRGGETVAGDPMERAAGLAAPFDDIAKGCLEPDPGRRWTASQVIARLRPAREPRVSSRPAPAPVKSAAARSKLQRMALPIGLAAAAVGVLGIFVLRPKTPPSPVAVEPPQQSAAAASQPVPPPAVPTAPARKAARPVPPDPRADSTRDRLAPEDGIVERVLPNTPDKARRTITGKPSIVVRVTADASGNVTEAKLERSFSPYFGRLAMDAARRWKFAPKEGAGAREWLLRFEFTRAKTQASARAIRP